MSAHQGRWAEQDTGDRRILAKGRATGRKMERGGAEPPPFKRKPVKPPVDDLNQA